MDRKLRHKDLMSVALNDYETRAAEDVIRHNPIVANVIRDIINDAFAVEPVATVGEMHMNIKGRLKELMDEVIIPCCKRNITSIFTLGLGLVVVAKSKDPRWEYVVKYPEDGGTIHTYYDHKTDTQKFYYERANINYGGIFLGSTLFGGDSKVKVLSGFGYDPSADGSLRSRVVSLVEEHAFITRLHDYYSIAASRSCDPILFTQRPEKASDDDEKFMSGCYGDRVKHTATAEDMYRRTREEREAAKFNNTMVTTIRKYGIDIMRQGVGGGGDPMYAQADSLPQDISIVGPYKVKPLAPGHTVANVAPPVTPHSFERLKEMAHETFYAMMGGGRGQFFGKDSRTVAGTKAVTEQYNRNLLSVKHMAGQIMTKCYNMLFEEDDMIEALCEIGKNGTRPTDSVLRDIMKGVKVTISLPPAPSDNFESMFLKYCVGSISKEELDTSNRISVGLSSELPQWNKGGGEWTDAMKILGARSLVHGTLANTPFGKGLKDYTSSFGKYNDDDNGSDHDNEKARSKTDKGKKRKTKKKQEEEEDESSSSSDSEEEGSSSRKSRKKRKRNSTKDAGSKRDDSEHSSSSSSDEEGPKKTRKGGTSKKSEKDKKKNSDKK